VIAVRPGQNRIASSRSTLPYCDPARPALVTMSPRRTISD
jgi:hypothetical protein